VVFDVSGMSGMNSFNISVSVLNKFMGRVPVPINPFLSSVWVNILGGFKEKHSVENHDIFDLYVLFIEEIFLCSSLRYNIPTRTFIGGFAPGDPHPPLCFLLLGRSSRSPEYKRNPASWPSTTPVDFHSHLLCFRVDRVFIG
jgi:hypothetical protein